MTHPFMYMLIPAACALLGGIMAAIWKPSRNMRSVIQHFAAGVILAALATELFPEISREHGEPSLLIGAFAVGSLLMFGLKLLTEHLEQRAELAEQQGAAPGLPFGILFATVVDIAVDGLIIGAGFAVGGETGIILALGLSIEMLFLGMALASDRLQGHKMILVTGLLGAEILLFAWLGHLWLSTLPHVYLTAILAASAAALLYLVTEELLIEAHHVPEKSYHVLVLFAGFLLFWAVQLMGVGS